MQSVEGIPYRDLGRTGESVSIIGLGGFHVGSIPDEQESIRLIRTAVDHGINFMDNSWDYHEGASEIRMGKALSDGYRDRVFLMTKIDGRTRDEAARQIEDSLRRLQVDVLDLLQFHEIIRMDDPKRIFAPGGAMEAVLEARSAGKVRYIGFTGHKDPDIHLEMLGVAFNHGFTFDTVQLPLNLLDAHYNSFERKVLTVLLGHGIGVLGMKPLSDGKLIDSGAVTAVEGLHYAMNLPVSVVITGCDSMEVLQQAIHAARSFRPLSEAEVETLLARTAGVAEGGGHERYKTTHAHDATHFHPEWLG